LITPETTPTSIPTNPATAPSATFPGAKFPLVPLTNEESALTSEEIRERLKTFTTQLAAFEIKLIAARDNENERKALEDEFRSLYLARGRTLKSLIVSQTKADPDDLPNGNTSDFEQMRLAQSIRLGRSSLGHGKVIGLQPATNVINYLNYLTEKLPP
jgi:hypothetical protein